MIALFDIKMGDAAKRGGANIDVGLGLDLPGAADDVERSWRTILAVSTLV